MLESPINKATRLMACNFIKIETPTQVFSCEYHKMFQKNSFYGTPPVAASQNGGLTWNELYDSTNLNVSIAKSWQLSITSDICEEILKPKKSHANRIIQIIPCKTALIQLEKDLCRRIYKRERFVKTFCSNQGIPGSN